jgi:amidase
VLTGDGVDHAAHAVADGLVGKRIGVPRRGLWGYSEPADAAAEHALGLMAAAGATLVDGTDLPGLAEFDWELELVVMLTELVPALAGYLASRDGAPRSLAEVVEFNRAHADQELSWFGQDLFERALELPAADSAEYGAARAACLQLARGGIDGVLAEHRLDALVAPSMAPALPIDLVNPEHHAGGCTSPSAMAGYPIISVPSGLPHGLPVGISFWAGAGSETTLIEIASGYETARDADSGPLPPPTLPTFV